MKLISIINLNNKNVITVDVDKLLLRIEAQNIAKETRIKPFVASFLYEIFASHSTPLSYNKIIAIFKQHNIVISDITRMHRKISEIRLLIQKMHHNLGLHTEDIILNTRGIGYTLPLYFKNLRSTFSHENKIDYNTAFLNQKITCAMQQIQSLIHDAINLTQQNKVIKLDSAYIMSRNSIVDNLSQNISSFDECEKIILTEIRLHAADFNYIRIQYILSKIRTYIGLARISQYPISDAQWLDWFTDESWTVFAELKKFLISAENI